ncbi:MAG: isopenicillin N synthase family oxygenase [Chloroflexales bacterium]|nr:isopenicillin N synthase family oxygenase [Chloroflexales bacterium]
MAQPAGQEYTRGERDWCEQVDIGAERDALLLAADQPPWARLRGPNQWPAALPELRDTILRYQAAAGALAIRVAQALAVALGQADQLIVRQGAAPLCVTSREG